ncbi:MAG TPA: glycosyltransferase family 4 protein [Streptosporangiaceae bacterium]|nr:glycosyltransferase family 4 protein [Streptosporangiaceae bacterium]
MKVAFVLGTSTGGTARHVRTLAAGCAARGVAAGVFGPGQTDRDFGFSRLAGGQVSFTPVEIADRPRVARDLRATRRLRRLLAAWRPDVAHAHGLRAGALTAIALAFVRPIVYHSRPALVVTVHNAPTAGGATGAVYRVLERIVAGRADSVLCVSPDLEERMRAAGARRVGRALVPAAGPAETPAETLAEASAEASATRPLPGESAPDRPLVLAAGRLAAQKGFDTLLEAAAGWRDLRPSPLLVIAGEGPLEASLKSQATRLGLDTRFAGHRDDIPALLAAAAVFVLPSTWEGQPLILQEALRAAVPIVATRVGGTPVLTGEDAAVLIPPGDARRLADAVRAVLTDEVLAARLRKAAAARGHALPSEADAVTAVLAEYKQTTAPPH